MERVKAVVLAAASLGLCVAATPAGAQSQGIIACQIVLGQFADDAVANRNRLNARQLDSARQLVDVGRNQCRSTPQLTMTEVQVTRNALRLPRSAAGVGNSWSVGPEEVASLSR